MLRPFAPTTCSAAGAAGPCSAVRVFEHGTAWAKPIDCKFAPFPAGVDCKARIGPIMYVKLREKKE